MTSDYVPAALTILIAVGFALVLTAAAKFSVRPSASRLATTGDAFEKRSTSARLMAERLGAGSSPVAMAVNGVSTASRGRA